jgi:hypothetical protein
MKITYLVSIHLYTIREVLRILIFNLRLDFSSINYYLHWDCEETVSHYENLICIELRKMFFVFFFAFKFSFI